MAKQITCATWGGPIFNAPATVILYQNGIDSFAVRYGLQLKTGLSYAQAASEFGACVMHACACDSKLDNRTRDEWIADGRGPLNVAA
jgi:hypothetical protein